MIVSIFWKFKKKILSSFRWRALDISADTQLLKDCHLFDIGWYKSQYSDIGDEPLKHFLAVGIFEDRSPHPLFDLKWYRNFYKIDKNTNPLIHFLKNSDKQELNPNAFFDTGGYREQYMKSSSKAHEAIVHYYQEGEKTGNLPSHNFDPNFYLENYPDVKNFKFGPLAHYIFRGRIQGQLPFDFLDRKISLLSLSLQQIDLNNISLNDTLSKYFINTNEVKDFFSKCNRMPEDIPARFIPDNYILYNTDLQKSHTKPLEAIRHFLIHGYRENRVYEELNVGEFANSFYSKWGASKIKFANYKPKLNVCVFVHIFYIELYEELKNYIKNLSALRIDLYFNIVENNWTVEYNKKIMEDFPEAKIIISQNIGRDIGGFFNLLSCVGNILDYDAFLLLHSKKSPHVSSAFSTKWRTDLLTATIGSKEIALQNMYLMENYANIGLIGTRLWRHKSIDKNTKKYYSIMKLLEISKENYNCDYLSGTIMWINSKAINYLYTRCKGLEFEQGDNRSLEFHMDGQFAHTIERALGNICKQVSLKMVFR